MSEVTHDIFCWVCGKKNTALKCSNCVRTFHKKCAKFKDDLCDECNRHDDYSFGQDHVELIPTVIHFLLSETAIAPMRNVVFKNINEIVKHIDLNVIAERSYSNFSELKSDIAWFAHNLKTKKFLPNMKKDQIEEAAKAIVKALDQEIHNLLLCSECYENAHKNPSDSITMPCVKNPHLLIWANCEEYGYWPAKAMSYNEEDMVYVRFFGDGTNACIPSSSCFLYSKQIPKSGYGPANDNSLALALKDTEKYIENVTKIFGNFNYAPELTVFEIGNYKNHWQNQIAPQILNTSNIAPEASNAEANDKVVQNETNNIGSGVVSSLKRSAPDCMVAQQYDRNKRVRAHVAHVLQEFQKSEAELAAMTKEKEDAVGQLAQLKTDLAAEKDKVKSFDQNLEIVKDMKEKLAAMTNEKEDAVGQLAQLKTDLAAEKDKVKNFDQNLEIVKDMKEKLAAMTKEKEDAVGQLAQLKTDLAAEKDKVKNFDQNLEIVKDMKEKLAAMTKEKEDGVRQLGQLQTDLAAEKDKATRTRHTCIVCSKNCFMYCGLECLNEHMKQQKQNDK